MTKKTNALPAETFTPDIPVWIDRGLYIAIEFELSTSSRFDQAVDSARKNPYFVELVDERGVTWYRAIFFKKEFPKFHELYELVGSWKNTRLYLKGHSVKKDDFELWYASYRQYWGHRKTLNEGDFCGLNKFTEYPDFIGCFERNIFLRWRDPLYAHYQFNSKVWYGFGKRQGTTFRVDKPAMMAFLKRINKEYSACACYGHELIEHYVHRLPNEINPLIHKDWQFKEDYLKLTANRAFFNYDIALSTLPDICPVNEKAYDRFMKWIFRD